MNIRTKISVLFKYGMVCSSIKELDVHPKAERQGEVEQACNTEAEPRRLWVQEHSDLHSELEPSWTTYLDLCLKKQKY